MKIKVFSLLVIMSLLPGIRLPLLESGSVHLNDLVQEALKVNPEIQMTQKTWEASRERAVQAGVLDDPMVGVEFEGIPMDTSDFGRYNDIEWSFSQAIPFPGKLSLKRKISGEEARKAYLEYREKEREIITKVKMAYVDFYLIDQTLQILDENQRLLDQFSKIAQKKYEVGKASQQDVLKAQVELAKVRNRILVQEQAKETARAKINTLLGRSPQALLGDPFPVDDIPIDLDFDKLIAMAVEHRPELKHHESLVKSGQYNVRLARRQYWPDFFARFESRQFQGTGLEEYDVMLGVTIPWLWTRSRADSGLKEAKASLQAAEKAYEAKRNEIFFEIKNALVKVETARSLVSLYQSDVLPTASQVVQVSQINYQTDKVDFLTLLDSQRNLLEFQLEYEMALADYHKNLAELERNVGVDLMVEKQEAPMQRGKD